MPEFELPETPETPESHKERTVGLIIAAIAVILAIVTHVGNEIQKEEVLAHIDATDQYSYYQAKKVRASQLDLNTDMIQLGYDRLSSAGQVQATQVMAHLADDGGKIKEGADDKVREAARLAARANVLDIGEIALQISVVLCSITILTEQGLFVRLGVAVAGAGILIAAWVIFLMN
jgi:hypothetical protein